MRFKLTAIGALALIPSLVVAQQTTSDTTMRDTTMRDTTVTTTSEGQLATPNANLGLTTDQVKELQKAINDNGCHAGEVTGTITDDTREGIDCIRQAKNIQSSDINDVLQALGLSFTVNNAQGQNAMSDTIASDTTTGTTYDTTTSDTTDTTMKSDTSTTFQTDSGALQRDTSTTPYDTSAVHDTTMMHDTTTVPDTSAMPRDTTMLQHDTTSMTRDSMPSTMPAMPTTPPTTTTLPDTGRANPLKP